MLSRWAPGHGEQAFFDPARARRFLLGGSDPADPIPARVGRDVLASSSQR